LRRKGEGRGAKSREQGAAGCEMWDVGERRAVCREYGILNVEP